ncbi:hypothetical protein [Rhodococcus koreensis]
MSGNTHDHLPYDPAVHGHFGDRSRPGYGGDFSHISSVGAEGMPSSQGFSRQLPRDVSHYEPRRNARGQDLSGRTLVEGQAHGIDRPLNLQGEDVINFRVESFDANGNRLRPVAVELRAYTGIQGSIGDGDYVRVDGQWKNGLLRSNRIENLTTGSFVGPRVSKRAMLIYVGIIVLIVVLLIAAFVTFVVISEANFNREVEEMRQQFSGASTW